MSKPIEALKRAVVIVGSQRALAEAIGAKQTTVSSWLLRGSGVSPRFCIPVEQATAGQITRHQLRPDLYPVEEARASSAVAADLAQRAASFADIVSEIEDMTEETRRNLKGARS